MQDKFVDRYCETFRRYTYNYALIQHLPAGRGAAGRRHGATRHPRRHHGVPHRHPALGAVSGVRPAVQSRARRAVAADAADAGVFIGLPLSILLGFLLLILMIGAMMGTFVGYMRSVLRQPRRRAVEGGTWRKKPTKAKNQKTRRKSVWKTRSSAATWSRARKSLPGSSSPARRWC